MYPRHRGKVHKDVFVLYLFYNIGLSQSKRRPAPRVEGIAAFCAVKNILLLNLVTSELCLPMNVTLIMKILF